MAERPAPLIPLPRCRVRPAVLDRIVRLSQMTGLGRCDVMRLAIDAGLTIVERDLNNNSGDQQR